MKHLLVIEDDHVDQMAFKRFVKNEEFPYSYTLVSSVKEAKDALKKEKFDAIVSDYFLTDGTTFEILELKKELPFIIVTGTGSEEIAVRAIKEGAFDYLIKDVEGYYLKMLPITIENALRRYDSEKQIKEYHNNLEELILRRTSELHEEIEIRKTAEDSLRLYQHIVTHSTDMMALVDNRYTYLAVNKAYTNPFNLSEENIIGSTVAQVFGEDFFKDYIKYNFDKCLDGNEINYRQWINFPKTGMRYMDTVYYPYYSVNNKQIGLVVNARDITKQFKDEQVKQVIYNITKKAHESSNLEILFHFIKFELAKLIKTNNFFIALYNPTADTISTPYMIDEKDDQDDFPKGKTLTGYVIDTKKALLANEAEIKDLNAKNKVEGQGPTSRCWLGVPLIVDRSVIGAIVVQSYTDEKAYSKNDVALLELVARNISNIVKQTKDLEQINLLNQAVLQNPESIFITNTNGEIEFINPAFSKLTGFSYEEVFGKQPSVLKSGKHPDDYYKKLWETLSDGKIWVGEFINRNKNGENYLVEANISPVKNAKGQITHYICIEIDITEKRRLERDFVHAFVEAQEIEKQNFGEELHDGISQILSAETMYIDILIQHNKNKENDNLINLNKIKELNLRAIDEARSVAHGLMSKQLKEHGLIKALEQICTDYSQKKEVKFSFSQTNIKEEELIKEIKTNIFRITQEISTNIVRHSQASKATISLVKKNKDSLILVIKDNGIGMDTVKLKKQSKGAGLNNIERRVKLLQGTLTIESKPKKGTTFTIKTPL
jgi:PAS domain S-box-containing protein